MEAGGTPGTEETIPQSVVTPTDTRVGVTDPTCFKQNCHRSNQY